MSAATTTPPRRTSAETREVRRPMMESLVESMRGKIPEEGLTASEWLNLVEARALKEDIVKYNADEAQGFRNVMKMATAAKIVSKIGIKYVPAPTTSLSEVAETPPRVETPPPSTSARVTRSQTLRSFSPVSGVLVYKDVCETGNDGRDDRLQMLENTGGNTRKVIAPHGNIKLVRKNNPPRPKNKYFFSGGASKKHVFPHAYRGDKMNASASDDLPRTSSAKREAIAMAAEARIKKQKTTKPIVQAAPAVEEAKGDSDTEMDTTPAASAVAEGEGDSDTEMDTTSSSPAASAVGEGEGATDEKEIIDLTMM